MNCPTCSTSHPSWVVCPVKQCWQCSHLQMYHGSGGCCIVDCNCYQTQTGSASSAKYRIPETKPLPDFDLTRDSIWGSAQCPCGHLASLHDQDGCTFRTCYCVSARTELEGLNSTTVELTSSPLEEDNDISGSDDELVLKTLSRLEVIIRSLGSKSLWNGRSDLNSIFWKEFWSLVKILEQNGRGPK